MSITEKPRPTILVFGATGTQGGSVARHLLAGGRFAVRALTRRPHSDEALTLGAMGAEVVPGDLSEASSVHRAMTGVHGVFGVTDWWEHFEESEAQGRNIVDAAAQAGVAHLVLSGLPSSVEATGGLVNAAPFEAKVAVERFARDKCLPATFVHVSFYWENLLSLFVPRPLRDGTFRLGLPIGAERLAGIGVDDIGGSVEALFAAGPAAVARTVSLAGDALTAPEIARTLSQVSERAIDATPEPIGTEWWHLPGAERVARDLDATFAAYRAMQDGIDAAVACTRALHPPTRDFATWAAANRTEFRWILDRATPPPARPPS